MSDSTTPSSPIDLGKYATQGQRLVKSKAERHGRTPAPRPTIEEIIGRHFGALMCHVTKLLLTERAVPLDTIIDTAYIRHPVSRPRVAHLIEAAHELFLELEAAHQRSQAARTKQQKESK